MYVIEQSDLIRIHAYFYEPILKRGWSYYMKNAVTNLEVSDQKAQASIEGTKTYRVFLDIKNFHKSTCTCPYGDSCKHMAAVVFEALDRAGQTPHAFLAPHKIHSLAPLRDAKPSKTIETVSEWPVEENSIEEWHRRFEKVVPGAVFQELHSYDVFFRNARRTLLPLATDWSPDTRAFYRLHVWLYLFQQLDEMNLQAVFLVQQNRALAHKLTVQWMDELFHDIENMKDLTHTEQYRNYLTDTVRFLGHAAFPQRATVVEWREIYRTFWSFVPTTRTLIDQEILRLRVECEQPISLERNKWLLVGRLHLEILTEQDATAMETAERNFPDLDENDLFEYLEIFAQSKQWDRLYEWLCWWRQKEGRQLSGIRYRYFDCWRSLESAGYIQLEEWEAVLVEQLPYSLFEFSQLLLQQNRCQEWVDLHLWHESDPLQMDKGDLKRVADTDLPRLLPLYHQAAERWIREKNRHAYKQAVKVLKKLRAHYRKLKLQPRWDRYIELLSSKYKRYRAFQEELQKGKLLP